MPLSSLLTVHDCKTALIPKIKTREIMKTWSESTTIVYDWLFNPPSLLLFKNLNTRETGPVATSQISSLLLSGTPLGLQQFPKIWLWNGAKLNKNRIARLLFWSLVGSTFTFSTEPLSTMTPHDNDFALCTGQLLGAWVRVQASSASTGNSACSLLPRWETLVTQRAWARAFPAWRSKA